MSVGLQVFCTLDTLKVTDKRLLYTCEFDCLTKLTLQR